MSILNKFEAILPELIISREISSFGAIKQAGSSTPFDDYISQEFTTHKLAETYRGIGRNLKEEERWRYVRHLSVN